MERKGLVLTLTPVLSVVLISAILQFTVLSRPEQVATWLSSFGIWFVLAYALIQAAAIIIAPIGGAFVWLPMLAIMGPGVGMLLTYFVSTPVYFINFFLAKKYGRSVVMRLVGKAGQEKIDQVAKEAGTFTFVILKVFQGGYFDYVSYAAGLTSMPLRTFTLINVLGGIPGTMITYFVLSRFDNFLTGVLAMYGVTGVLIGISIYLNRRLLKKSG